MKFSAVSALLLLAREASSFGVPPPRFAIQSTHSMCFLHHSFTSSSSALYMTQSDSSSTSTANSPEAHDGEALQHLFSKQCDKDGLMTKSMLMSVPAIQELLVRMFLNTQGCVTEDETNCSRITPPKFAGQYTL